MIGKVCMDQFMVDLGPESGGVCVGDTAVLFGDPGTGAASADEWGAAIGSHGDEIINRIAPAPAPGPTSAPITRTPKTVCRMSPEASGTGGRDGAERLSAVTLEQFLAKLPPELKVLHDGGNGSGLLRWVEPSELEDPTPYLLDGEFLLTAGLPSWARPATRTGWTPTCGGWSGPASGPWDSGWNPTSTPCRTPWWRPASGTT